MVNKNSKNSNNKKNQKGGDGCHARPNQVAGGSCHKQHGAGGHNKQHGGKHCMGTNQSGGGSCHKQHGGRRGTMKRHYGGYRRQCGSGSYKTHYGGNQKTKEIQNHNGFIGCNCRNLLRS